MTYSKPLSISCTEIASDWYFLVRDISILHEDVGGKVLSKSIVSVLTLGIQFGQVTASSLERIRRHCLSVEKQMYAIQRKIKSLATDLDALTDELAAAQTRLYDQPHTIPTTLAGEDIDMTLSMFATQLFVMESPNPSIQIARSYENLCMRAYGLFWKDTSTKQEQSRLADDEALQQEPSTGKEVSAHLASCLVGLALAPQTFGLSLIAPLYTQFRLDRIHSKKYQ